MKRNPAMLVCLFLLAFAVGAGGAASAPATTPPGADDEQKARAALASGRVSLAARHYTRLLQGQPDNVGYRMELAQCYEIEGHLDLAAQHAGHILSRDKNHVAALQLMGRISGRAGDWGSARDYYMRALRHEKTDARLYLGMGEALEHLGLHDEAENHFEQFRKLTESSVQ